MSMEVEQLPFANHRCPFRATLAEWKDYYFIYNHRILFVIGLVLSRSLTNRAFVSALAWFLTSNGTGVMNSAILSDVQDSLSSIFELFMALAADSFIGRFRTLLFLSIAYLSALVLLLMIHSYNMNGVLVITVILTSLGTSGDRILQDALVDIVHDIDKSDGQAKKRSIARATIWSRGAYVSGALIAILWVAPDAIGGVNPSWKSSFLICLITMTLALFIFGVGHFIYHRRELTVEINLRQGSSTNSDLGRVENEGIAPDQTSILHLDTEQKGDNTNTSYSYNQEVTLILKSLLKMFPMWGVLFVVPIISATGSAFFSLQFNNLNTNNNIAVQSYSLVQDFSKFVIPFIYGWICCLPKNKKVKIGVGMICGVLSCICAWQLEVYRLKAVSHLNNMDDQKTSISFLWLVPQFCLLGLMEGLTEDGLSEFMSQVKYLGRYQEEYIAFVMGIGKLLNIFLILKLKRWFGNTVNDSRLDEYYRVLVCMGSASFIIYCCIARFFYMGQGLDNENKKPGDPIEQIGDNLPNQDLVENEEEQQDHLREQISDNLQERDLFVDDQEEQDYRDLANDDLQQDHLMEQIRDTEQNQDLTKRNKLSKRRSILRVAE